MRERHERAIPRRVGELVKDPVCGMERRPEDGRGQLTSTRANATTSAATAAATCSSPIRRSTAAAAPPAPASAAPAAAAEGEGSRLRDEGHPRRAKGGCARARGAHVLLLQPALPREVRARIPKIPRADVEERREARQTRGRRASAGTSYTCPMHPEIVRDQPGTCPICGMALEPRRRSRWRTRRTPSSST